jgi:hypothetical protein
LSFLYDWKFRDKAFRVEHLPSSWFLAVDVPGNPAGDGEPVRSREYPAGKSPTIYFTGKREIIR